MYLLYAPQSCNGSQRKGGGKNKHVLKGRLKILGNPETKRTGLGQER